MLAKFLFVVTLLNLTFGTQFQIPRDDLIILESGERIEGQISSIMSTIIKIETKSGEKTVVRDVNIYSPRDIVETGVIKYNRLSGQVAFLGPDYLEIKTTTGMHKVNRALVRKIILSHESSLPPLDL